MIVNYFNYFTEIEEHFQRARGTGLFLMSPLDWALVESWKKGNFTELVSLSLTAGLITAVNAFGKALQAVIATIPNMMAAATTSGKGVFATTFAKALYLQSSNLAEDAEKMPPGAARDATIAEAARRHDEAAEMEGRSGRFGQEAIKEIGEAVSMQYFHTSPWVAWSGAEVSL